ncbi:type VI secretion system protein TssA [Vibrio sp. ZSDZ65]|uniref:Type VI secretion system protein TssA n=1 Tax=Vibrio qingdaonensis TaxID=2829491 RepID=A0A9X3HYU6_9VIBR|nr:type VI secretion system protein TssA [Vibrio qingdaonensis]MCW8348653.1 type VI secretion system protein TssA [Vibrio qingdaonensis]
MSIIDCERLLAPISEQAPSGGDARYESCYERMESEVKKFGSLFGETVDWDAVKSLSTEVLEHHSKDIKAICYLVRSLVEEHDLVGLELGLTLFNELLTRYASDLYPKRKRGRDGAIEWLNNQIKLVGNKLAFQSLDRSVLLECLTLIGQLQYQLDDVFHDSEADFFEIKTQLNTLLHNAESSGVIPGAVTEQTAEVAEAHHSDIKEIDPAPLLEAPVVDVQKAKPLAPKSKFREQDVDTDFSSPSVSKRSLKKVAEMMIYSDPSNSLAYRIYRHLTWYDIDGLPENQNNQTELSLAVSTDQQSNYQDKAMQESDVDTIKRLERTLTDAPFWLTGHYFVYSMLNNLGWQEAASAVEQEVRLFVQRFEGIEHLSFKNSIPFADEATLKWLSTSVAATSSRQAVITTVVTTDDSLPMEDITLANLGEYAAELSQKLELDNSGRGQFTLYLQLVKAYQNAGLFPLCLPYLEKGWEVKKEFNLASWEPHLSMQLDGLIQKTLRELFRTKDRLPTKYKEWEIIYD